MRAARADGAVSRIADDANRHQQQRSWPAAGGTVTAGQDCVVAEAEGDDDEDDEFTGAGSEYETPLIQTTTTNAGMPIDGAFPKTRHIFGLMGFLGFAVVYAMRVNLSVAIVAMVNQTANAIDNTTASSAVRIVDDTCPKSHHNNNTNGTAPSTAPEGEFNWDEATQGLVLGSFFYGYVLTQIPGGRLAEVIGGKRIYGYGVLMTAIFTLLTPPAARWSLPLLVVVRILEGMGEGVTYPAMHAMLARWIPPMERNKFAAVVYAGSNIGTVISMPLAGWLCSLQFMGGWPLAFYIFGLLGLLWFGCWMLLVYDSPDEHPWIRPQERAYIKQTLEEGSDPAYSEGGDSLGVDKYYDGDEESSEEEGPEREIDEHSHDDGEHLQRPSSATQEPSTPWRRMLTSAPLWAILITQCGQSWAFYTQLTELPTYLSNILHYDIEANAMLNALPPLTAWLVGIACSTAADWLLARRYITLLNSYKLWNSVASIVPALGLIGVGYVGCSWLWVTFMLAVLGSFGGAVYAGNQMNHIALSPRYAGTMYGLTNSAANICGFMAPYVIGRIINHHETLDKWRIVFWLAAAFSIGGNFVYLLLASADEQSWSQSSCVRSSTHAGMGTSRGKRTQSQCRRRKRSKTRATPRGWHDAAVQA